MNCYFKLNQKMATSWSDNKSLGTYQLSYEFDDKCIYISTEYLDSQGIDLCINDNLTEHMLSGDGKTINIPAEHIEELGKYFLEVSEMLKNRHKKEKEKETSECKK